MMEDAGSTWLSTRCRLPARLSVAALPPPPTPPQTPPHARGTHHCRLPALRLAGRCQGGRRRAVAGPPPPSSQPRGSQGVLQGGWVGGLVWCVGGLIGVVCVGGCRWEGEGVGGLWAAPLERAPGCQPECAPSCLTHAHTPPQTTPCRPSWACPPPRSGGGTCNIWCRGSGRARCRAPCASWSGGRGRWGWVTCRSA